MAYALRDTRPMGTPPRPPPRPPRRRRTIPPPDFGPTLRAARHQAGLSLRALAQITGVNFGYIGELERGVKTCSRSIAEDLIAALGITGDDAARIRGSAVTDAGRDFPTG